MSRHPHESPEEDFDERPSVWLKFVGYLVAILALWVLFGTVLRYRGRACVPPPVASEAEPTGPGVRYEPVPDAAHPILSGGGFTLPRDAGRVVARGTLGADHRVADVVCDGGCNEGLRIAAEYMRVGGDPGPIELAWEPQR